MPIAADNNGGAVCNSRIRYEDLIDGSMYTLFLGEKTLPRVQNPAALTDLGWASGTNATLRNASSLNQRMSGAGLAAATNAIIEGGEEANVLAVGGFSSLHTGGAERRAGGRFRPVSQRQQSLASNSRIGPTASCRRRVLRRRKTPAASCRR